MRRIVLCGLLVLAGCSGEAAETPSDRLGAAFCADLRAGMTPFQIVRPMLQEYGSEGMAARGFMWAEEFCPEQLETNVLLREWLEPYGHQMP